MAINLDTTFKLKAKVEGAKSVDNFKKQLRGLDTSSKMSKVQLGKMNIEINRMARAAGNTTKGLREHIRALTLLRDRTDIGGKAYKRLGSQIDRLKSKLKGLDGQAASTGQKLASLVATLGVGRGIRRIVGGAATYEAEVTKAAAIEGGGNKTILDDSVKATAQIAAGTPQEVAELATVFARAGFNADEISQSLNGVVLGAEATGVAFADLGSVTSNNLRAFGLETSKTSNLVDILVSAANSSNQTVLDLGESLKYAAPVARTFGLTVNDTAATISLLANAGIKGSEAGTALRTGLSRLQIAATGTKGELLGITRGSKMLTTAMKALGADILDTEGNLKPMDQVITALRDNLSNFDTGQQAEIAKALFGTEAGSKFLSLLNQSDADISKMFDTVRNSGGVTAETRKNMDSFALTTKVLGGNFEILTNQIGGAFISVLDPLAKLLNQFLTDISKLPKPVKDFGAGLAAAGIAALALKVTMVSLTALGVKALIFSKVAAAFVLLKKAVLGVKAAMILLNLTNPLGWVALGVGALALLIAKIKESKEEIGKFFKSVRDGLYRYVILAFNALPKFIRELLIGKNNRAAGDDFTITLPEVKVPKENELKGDQLGKSGVGGGITPETGDEQKSVLGGMKDALEEYRTKAADVAGQVKNAMGNALQGMEDALVNFVMTGKLAFGDLARSILADITRIVIRSAIISPLLGSFGIKVGSANGNVFQGGEVQKFAYGGIVSRPTIFPMKNGMGLMGEAGAEAIMPLKRGSDGKLGVTAQGGGSNVVNVSVNASGTTAQGNTMKASQLGKMIGTAIEAELIKQKRPGGILYT